MVHSLTVLSVYMYTHTHMYLEYIYDKLDSGFVIDYQYVQCFIKMSKLYMFIMFVIFHFACDGKIFSLAFLLITIIFLYTA
jgi:hypothetical protein